MALKRAIGYFVPWNWITPNRAKRHFWDKVQEVDICFIQRARCAGMSPPNTRTLVHSRLQYMVITHAYSLLSLEKVWLGKLFLRTHHFVGRCRTPWWLHWGGLHLILGGPLMKAGRLPCRALSPFSCRHALSLLAVSVISSLVLASFALHFFQVLFPVSCQVSSSFYIGYSVSYSCPTMPRRNALALSK